MKRIPLFLILSIIFLCCSEEQDEINNTIAVDTVNKTVNNGELFSIKAISDLPLTYISENEYHAVIDSIDPWDNAIIKAGYVGQTVIKISNGEDTQEVNLIVSPRSDLFPTPNLDYFGTTKQEIISLLGTPFEETETNITYDSYSDNAPYITYSFDDEDKLYSITVAYKISSPFALNNYLTERYRLAGVFYDEVVGSGYAFYNSLKNIDPTYVIYVYGLNQDYDAVVYRPYVKEETNSKTSLSLSF